MIDPHAASHDPDRYRDLTDTELAHWLHDMCGQLLLRGTLQTLLARRDIGGLLTEFACRYPTDRGRFESFALRTTGLGYSEARRHMQLWVHWPRCLSALKRVESEAKRHDLPFVVPGLRRLLALAGVVAKRGFPLPPDAIDEPEPIDWVDGALPDDVSGLKRIIETLRRDNRILREKIVLLSNQIRQMPNPASRSRRGRR